MEIRAGRQRAVSRFEARRRADIPLRGIQFSRTV